MLARGPSSFAGSGDITNFYAGEYERLPYTMTNQGLELRLPLATVRNVPQEIEEGFLPCQQNQVCASPLPGTAIDWRSLMLSVDSAS